MSSFQYIIDEAVAVSDQEWSAISRSTALEIASAFAITPQELGTVQEYRFSSTSYLRSNWSRDESVWGMTPERIENAPAVPRVPVENWPRPTAFSVTATNTTAGTGTGYFISTDIGGSTLTQGTGTTHFFSTWIEEPPVDEYALMQRIKEPLTTLMRRHPEAISVLLQKIEDGLIDGSTYGSETHFQTHPLSPRACCLVGWIMRTKRIMTDMDRPLRVKDRGILENYVSDISAGATHKTNFHLAVLHYLLIELEEELAEKPAKKKRASGCTRKRTPKQSPDVTPLLTDIEAFLLGERSVEPIATSTT